MVPEASAGSADHPPQVQRTTGSRVLVLAVLAVSAIALITIVIQVPPAQATALAGLAIGPALVVWVLYGHPHLRWDAAGLTIVNPYRTHVLPWSAVTGFDLRLGLTVEHAGGRPIPVWALPSAGRRVQRGEGRRAAVVPHRGARIDAVLEAHQRFESGAPLRCGREGGGPPSGLEDAADAPLQPQVNQPHVSQPQSWWNPLSIVLSVLAAAWAAAALLVIAG